VANEARLMHLNSLYGVSIRHGLRELGRDLLPMAVLNSASLLTAEMIGRAYGGGLLKLEPKEADRWWVPSEALLRDAESDLRNLRPQLATALRANKVAEAARLVDRELLVRRLGVSSAVLAKLRGARSLLFSRRITRGRGSRGAD
jgi:adenine-specific DNA-methyltransferase